MPQVHHALTIFPVRDVARALAFYRDAIGLTVVVDLPVFAQLTTSSGAGLGLYERASFAATAGLNAPPPGGGAELYLSVDDLDAAIARAQRFGAPMTSARAPRPWGDEAAYFTDPDGNVVALASELDGDGRDRREGRD